MATPRRRTLGLSLLMAIMAATAVHAADPQPYTVTISGAGSGAMGDALDGASQLASLKDKVPVAPFGLVARAQSDMPRLETVLESFGYYQSKIAVSIADHPLDDPDLLTAMDTVPNGQSVAVDVRIVPGPLYRVGTVALEGNLPAQYRSALGLAAGDPAIAGNILGAQTRLLDALRDGGYALAKVEGPIATANDSDHRIDVSFTVDSGPQVEIGAIRFQGLHDVNESFVRRALTIEPGERYSPLRIEAARQALLALGVFSDVSVRAADALSADGRLPLTFDVAERPRRAVTLSGTYSTDLGISAAATWSHRNLFGNAEQLNLTASAGGLGSASVGLTYNLSAQFIKPLFLRNDQAFEFDISGVKQDLIAYNQRSETSAGFVRRTISPAWKASVGLSLTHDEVMQEGASALYQLIALPATINYDSTGVTGVLQDPTKGLRASLALTPTASIGTHDDTFFVLQASASPYFDLGGDGRSVLALRGFAGDILGGSNLSLPPDQRLYLGGSNTVRAFAYETIGPLYPDGKPEGAKAVDAGTIEFRQRILEDWGAALFVDAGQAGAAGLPFTGTVRVGIGAGVRYYTPIGPVRLDFAVPANRIPGGDAFEIYIGLGQAF